MNEICAFDIVLRTCSRVQVLSRRPRMSGLQKFDVTTRCLRSLVRSLVALPGYQDLVRLTIVDDASEPMHVRAWSGLLNDFGVSAHWVILEPNSGKSSFLNAIEAARGMHGRFVYFVEDDYLHYGDAVDVMVRSYVQLQRMATEGLIAMTTYDCPDRYTRPPYPATICFAGDRYWRTVRHTTGTFAVSRDLLERYWGTYTRFGAYGKDDGITEDTTINRVYAHVPCFSPIPTLSIHLQYEDNLPLLLPDGGWSRLWDSLAD